ncbi:MAG: flagellar basal body P-ring formation protein FlgA [Spirochaetales bacterium]|nr:flagellar basal body P-ring formation protein FlgA [Spirochaetales bacterium]
MKANRILIPLILLITCRLLPGLTLYLKDRIDVNEYPVTIRDVCRPAAGLQTLAEKVLSLPLDTGRERLLLLPARIVRKKLEETLSRSVTVIGKRMMIIPRQLVRQGSAVFYDAFLSYLDSIDPEPDSLLETEVLVPPEISRDLLIGVPEFRPANPLRKEVSYLSGDIDFYYEYAAPGKQGQTGIISLRFHSILPVAVALKDLSCEERLQAEDVLYEDKDTSMLPEGVLTVNDNLDVYKVSSPVKKGEVISRRKLIRENFIQSGERVRIVFVLKNIRLTMPGKAYKGGNPGDTIPVQGTIGGEKFFGKIMSRKEVLVELDS